MAFIINDNSHPSYHCLSLARHFVQCRSKHYSLERLETYNYFAELLPILQKALTWTNEKLARVIEISLLLNDEMPDELVWLDNRNIFCDFFSLEQTCSDYEVSVVKDFVILQNSLNHIPDIEKYYEFETELFKHLDRDYIRSCAYQVFSELDPSGDFELYKTYLNIKMPSELTQDLLFEFIKNCNTKLNISTIEVCSLLTSELYAKYNDDNDINSYELSSQAHRSPLVFCFLVAYVKANNLFSINNDIILKCLHPHFILAFREFWWKCEVWGNNKDAIKQQIKNREFKSYDSCVFSLSSCHKDGDSYFIDDSYKRWIEEDYLTDWYFVDRLFSIGSDFAYKYDVYCTNSEFNGITIKMSDDYLNPDGILLKDKNIPDDPILNENLLSQIKLDTKKVHTQEVKRKILRSYLNYEIDTEDSKVDEILSILIEMARGGKAKKLITIMFGAVKAGFIDKHLPHGELIKLGFGDIGNKQGYSQILKDATDDKSKYIFDKYPEVDIYYKNFMKLKVQYSKKK